MTWGNPPKFKSTPSDNKKGKVITPEMLAARGSEDGEQAALFCWAADNVGKYPQLKWLFAIPNGGSRHIAEATKMVATGLRGGVPDIFLPYPMQKRDYQGFAEKFSYGYHGCFIELKIEKRRYQKNGGCSQEQLEWIIKLRENYYIEVCYGWQNAKNTLIAYLEGRL